MVFGKRKQADVIHRWDGNPIITLEDLPFHSNGINNAGAIKYKDDYLLLLSVADLKGHSAFYKALSKDGYRFKIEKEPFMQRSFETVEYERNGISDARITPLEGKYYITYQAEGVHGYRTGLAVTEDFNSVERINYLSQPDTKSSVLFPEKINGRYARLERPDCGYRIWISYSDDLTYWGDYDAILSPRAGFWDSMKIGVAGPPVRSPKGNWLVIYYGVRNTSAGPLYRIGAFFLDGKNPNKVIRRTNVPILSPREMYERVGDVNNVVYSCGAIVEGGTLALYYGGADSCICLGYSAIDEIIENCIESERAF